MPEKIKDIEELVVYQVDNGFTVTVRYHLDESYSFTRSVKLIASNLEEVHNIINEWFSKVQKNEGSPS